MTPEDKVQETKLKGEMDDIVDSVGGVLDGFFKDMPNMSVDDMLKDMPKDMPEMMKAMPEMMKDMPGMMK